MLPSPHQRRSEHACGASPSGKEAPPAAQTEYQPTWQRWTLPPAQLQSKLRRKKKGGGRLWFITIKILFQKECFQSINLLWLRELIKYISLLQGQLVKPVQQVCSESLCHSMWYFIVQWLFIAHIFICFGLGSPIKLNFFKALSPAGKSTGPSVGATVLRATPNRQWATASRSQLLRSSVSTTVKLGGRTRESLKNFQFYCLDFYISHGT